MNLGFCYSRIREDEKLVLEELRRRDHDVTKVDVRRVEFDVDGPPAAFDDVDLLFNRCLESSRARYVARFARSYGVPVVNGPETVMVCADKVRGSLALREGDVPTPETTVAFDRESALAAVERFGYPCVMKPVTGSWGRLVSKIDTRDAAETVLDHKETLGNYEHKVFYIQEFVEKPGRDIRVVTADGEPVAAMVRSSEHWLTNAAKGATTAEIPLDDELEAVARAASDAVGGGLLGVDVMETPEGYTVHEVNSGVEFKALNRTVDADVPARIVDWLEVRADAS